VPEVNETPGVTAYVALGGNLGDVLTSFRRAIDLLAQRGVVTVSLSSAYRTEALRAAAETKAVPDYWNAVAGVRAALSPRALLTELNAVEAALGRVRRERWASRPIDLDLLLYGDKCLRDPDLIVPHPSMAERVFVLRPLVEIAPEVRVPPEGHTATMLLSRHGTLDAGIHECLPAWHELCGSSDAGCLLRPTRR
jgi:2-amino-4-hydroxy-6-hydroxymethyldihydropteridine diphosphokinase